MAAAPSSRPRHEPVGLTHPLADAACLGIQAIHQAFAAHVPLSQTRTCCVSAGLGVVPCSHHFSVGRA